MILIGSGERGFSVGFLIYPGFNALDLVGPHEVLARLDGRAVIVAEAAGMVVSEQGLKIWAEESFASCPPLRVLVVAGGPGQSDVMANRELLAFIEGQAAVCDYVAGVCTGALILGAAGLLAGRHATTHWLAMKELERYGATAVEQRVVWDGNVITGAGVSAGIDLGLELAAALGGEENAKKIELGIEYDPSPPFHCGHPRSAPPHLILELKRSSRFYQDGPMTGGRRGW